MNLSRSLSLLLAAACLLTATPAFAKTKKKKDDSSSTGEKTTLSSLFSHILHPFGQKTPTATAEGKPGWRNLAMGMALEPAAIKLGEARQVKVTVSLANRGKKFVQLEFPTTQRIEVVIRNTAGKMVEQWSEDRTFTNEPGLISINPNERLEYTASISTRDMAAGQAYIVEAFFPQYEQLRVQKSVTPEK